MGRGAAERLRAVVARLVGLYGPTPEPPSRDPFELVLWENVAYLADDERRAEAMESLRRTVGTAPRQIREATSDGLSGAVGKGILPKTSEKKLRDAAALAMDEFGGDLSRILDLPADRAKRALRRFPGIGEPGADKILLTLRRHPSIALESNGLRVLVRLGLLADDLSYSATYAAAVAVARDAFGDDYDTLLSARHALRRHGQETCRRNVPACAGCALREGCAFASHPESDEVPR